MNSTKGSARARLLTTTLLAGLAAVATPLTIATIATVAPTVASAQDYTSGTLSGRVLDLERRSRRRRGGVGAFASHGRHAELDDRRQRRLPCSG
ncbi:hypothetical protein ACRAWD_05915 [Caulobacter segnis]